MLRQISSVTLKQITDLINKRYCPPNLVYCVISLTATFMAYVILKELLLPDLSRWHFLGLSVITVTLLSSIFVSLFWYREHLTIRALRQSEERYRIVAEFAYDWEYMLNPDRRFIYSSPSCERITGYKPDEFLKNPDLLDLIIHPDDRILMETHIHQLSDTGESLPIEFRIINRNGEERWIGHVCQPVYGTNGRFLGRRACNRDITEQKWSKQELEKSLSLLQATVDSITNGILVVDRKGRVRLYNNRFAELWRIPVVILETYDDNQLLTTVLEQLKDPQSFLQGVKELYTKSEAESFDVIKLKDGRVFERFSRPQRLGSKTIGRVWSFLDVTKSNQVQEELRKTNEELESLNEELVANDEELRSQFEELQQRKQDLKAVNQRLLDIIEFLPDATFVIDHHKRVITWNRAIEEMTGVPKEDIVGKGDYAYAIPFYGETRPMIIDFIWAANKDYEPKYEYLAKKGDTLFAEVFIPSLNHGHGAFLRIKAAPMYDTEGNLIGAIQSVRDITDRKRAEEQLKHLSLHDSLTGLYNRTYFEQEMLRFSGYRYLPVGIIVCDVDGLKLINDTLGHVAGDKLLIATAGILKNSFQTNDVVARIGGDEFAILLPHTDHKTVANTVKRINDTVAAYNEKNPNLFLSISVGFTVSDEPPVIMDNLFKEADNNMYRVKLHHNQSTRSAIVQTLMKALEARDFITEGHADRLQDLVAGVALSLGLPERSIADLRLLAQFHDIGKVGIPDRILFKVGALTSEEFAEMKQHCEIGHRIAKSAPDLGPIADWVLKHHEWWNGEGYPLGLKGEKIPLECRILAIADAYDAMTSDRPYRRAMNYEQAVAELERCAGTQFDPQLVIRFIQSLGI